MTNLYRDFGVKSSNLVITPSEYLKGIVSGWGYSEEKIEVVYNAVEFEEAVKKIPKDKFRIVSVARLIPHKGIEAILQVLSRLDFDYEYVLIGDGPLREKLESLAKELNVNVLFKGNISKRGVANWLNSSDLFILNSSYEGLPHIVLEAMQNDCPVIASRVGGTPEIVKNGENGLLFEHNNIEQLLENIYLIKKDEILREKLVSNGKSFVGQFADVEKMVDRYLRLFEEVV